jgi:hypothetical protein
MSDCFISYSRHDERFAEFVRATLVAQGVSTFKASASLKPGEHWSSRIRANLTASSWVLFLASRAACQSAYVQQELGMALAGNKKLIPIVWDIAPSELPGWVSQTQALNLCGATGEQVRDRILEIARRIKAGKVEGRIVGAALLAGFVYAITRK